MKGTYVWLVNAGHKCWSGCLTDMQTKEEASGVVKKLTLNFKLSEAHSGRSLSVRPATCSNRSLSLRALIERSKVSGAIVLEPGMHQLVEKRRR